ncbi:hypothetical protein [Tomitella gaofuii]|uniref:hypothetical protein n=1 Tax=Tomitella gaofuii TaxID=2760083 RepID=UPI0015F8B821|nr:hypothetical protein [Tomitella gaofuii]
MIGDHGPYAATIHTVDGELLGDLALSQVVSTKWSRELNEVSRGTVVSTDAVDIAEHVTPWQHWITLWDGRDPVWSGPILKTTDDGRNLTVDARDVGCLLSRTRTTASQVWAGQGPQRIAADLWNQMLRLHRVNATPDVYPMPTVDRFDYNTSTDSTLLSQNMSDLVKLGLQWTIIAGRPVLGTVADDPVAELADCDFLEDTQLVRDGTRTANDVMVQGQNYAHTYVAPLGGLRLQALVSIDDLFGVSNIKRATRQYTELSGVIRQQIIVPSSVTLHQDAEVSLGDLIPGALFIVHSRGMSQIMRLVKVEVANESGSNKVAVSLETIQTTTELGEKTTGTEVAL